MPDAQSQIDQLMKLVYFESDEFESVTILDLIEGASDSNRNGMGGMLGGLE